MILSNKMLETESKELLFEYALDWAISNMNDYVEDEYDMTDKEWAEENLISYVESYVNHNNIIYNTDEVISAYKEYGFKWIDINEMMVRYTEVMDYIKNKRSV